MKVYVSVSKLNKDPHFVRRSSSPKVQAKLHRDQADKHYAEYNKHFSAMEQAKKTGDKKAYNHHKAHADFHESAMKHHSAQSRKLHPGAK